jgi:hypothetical protein
VTKTLKDHRFWIGVVVGTIVGPMLVNKVAPSVGKNLPK